MTPEAWAAVFTAVSAFALHWIDRRDARRDASELHEDAELSRLRSEVVTLAADRDRWRERYYDCKAGRDEPANKGA